MSACRAYRRWSSRIVVAAGIACVFCHVPQASFGQGKKAASKKDAASAPAAASTPDAESTEAEVEAPEETTVLPLLDKMELPSFERLMKGPALDWIVMHSQRVLVVEPLYPRPGTLDDVKRKIASLTRKAGEPAESEGARRRRLAAYYLPLTLTEGEDREYRLHIRFIKEIIYYDDLMLRRVDALLDEKKFREAFELLVAVEQRQADWPGIVPRQERLLFTEASAHFSTGQPEHALALLESLHERNAAYPGLEDQMAVVCDRLMRQAFDAADPRQARFYLRRLTAPYPQQKVAATWSNRLLQTGRDLLTQAKTAERAEDVVAALDLAERAARYAPSLPEVLNTYNRLSRSHPRLRVGVLDAPPLGPQSPGAVPTDAQRRHRELTETPLFSPVRFDDKMVRYATPFFDDWTPTDLGHRVLLRLRHYRGAGESQPPLTSAGLVAAMFERLTPGTDAFDARFAASVAGLSVRGPFELAVDFRQVPLRPEALFAFAYRQARSASGTFDGDDETASGQATRGEPAGYPFRLQRSAPDRTSYVRSVPEPESTVDRHVAEIVEIRYASPEKSIQGLLRGEVSYLHEIPPWSVKSLVARSEFFIESYGLPQTHFLQFHPGCRALGSRALRRALVYALDRGRLLEEEFLHEPPGALGRLTTAAWPTTSYAYSRFVEPHFFDAALAYSLARTAEKELAAPLSTLRVWAPASPPARIAAARIVAAWNAAGVPATLLPNEAPGPGAHIAPEDAWDVVYRIERIVEPLVDLWPLLALTTSTETAGLGYLPTWLRHDLLELDRVGDWRSAEQLLHNLHRQFASEVYLLPLWEIEQHRALRKTIRDAPERPLSTYQSVERWKVEPWFPRD